MEYLKQNSNGVKAPIRTIGCFYRSCLWIAEKETGKAFTASQINELWDSARERNYIDINFDLVHPDRLITLALRELGDDKTTAYQIGIFSSGELSYWNWVNENPEYKRIDYFIQKIKSPENYNSLYHFRVVNNRGIVIFEPYSTAICPAGIEYSTLYHLG